MSLGRLLLHSVCTMELGRWISKVFCHQPDLPSILLQASFSKTSSSMTLSYHMKAKLHAV